MIRKLIVCLWLSMGFAFADQVLLNPCSKAKGVCEFSGVSPTGIPFKLWNDAQDNTYIKLSPPGKQPKTFTLVDITDTFAWTCPDILEEISPGGGEVDSFFTDFTNEKLYDGVPNVFAVNCQKKVVAYENDTMMGWLGDFFISPLNDLHQVIMLDKDIDISDYPFQPLRSKSYFDSDNNLVLTYISNSPNLPTHNSSLPSKEVTIKIPVNYNDFVYSHAIDCPMSLQTPGEDVPPECNAQGSGS